MFSFPLAPARGSEFADKYDLLFYTILGLTVFFTLLVGIVTLFLVIRYRRGTKVNRDHPPHENLPLEITWSAIPLVLGLVIFAWGAQQFVEFKTPPKSGLEVYCVGKQWMWHFQHAETGIRENNMLHVPVGEPIKVTMISQDVIHDLYFPDMRIQYQVVPGEYTQMWFKPTMIGVSHIFCNMYCGTQHSEMGGYLYVMSKADYQKWSENGGNDPQPMSIAQRGHLIFNRLNCGQCHAAVDNERAPSLYGIYGKPVKYTDGTISVMNDAGLRQAILEPYNHIVKGYGNTMPQYQGAISESDLIPLMEYVKTLGNTAGSNTISTEEDKNGVPLANNVKEVPKLSVGALHELAPKTPTPSKNNLSVGALAGSNRQPGN